MEVEFHDLGVRSRICPSTCWSRRSNPGFGISFLVLYLQFQNAGLHIILLCDNAKQNVVKPSTQIHNPKSAVGLANPGLDSHLTSRISGGCATSHLRGARNQPQRFPKRGGRSQCEVRGSDVQGRVGRSKLEVV